MPDPYDGLQPGPTPFKPTTPGATLEPLTLTDVHQAESGQFKNDDGSPRVGLILTGTLPDGSEHDWAAWSARAKRAALEARALAGDTIRITYVGEVATKPGLSAAKDWNVEILARASETALDDDDLPVGF
ncbi:MAG: hypothetical protein ACXVRQ_12665 [Gaiellaceae bacterium]